MTDEQSPDSASSDPTNGSPGGGNPEEDLDAAIADAASLSADLTNGVGETEKQTTDDRVEPAAGEADEVTSDLDAELTEMEQLLETTSSDLGTESSEDEEEEKPAPPETSAEEVPAFMAEFTQPEPGDEPTAGEQEPPSPPAADEPTPPAQDENEGEPTPSGAGADAEEIPAFMAEFADPGPGDEPDKPSAEEPAARPAIPPNAGIVGTGKVGVVGSSGPAGTQTQPTASGAAPISVAEALEEGRGNPKPSPIRSITERLSPLVLPACECCTRILEIVDKPTGGVSEGIRRIIGLVALATLGTALFVFLSSLF